MDTRAISGDEAWRPSFNPYLIAVSVMLATFMEVLDTSIANVALPHIAGSLAALDRRGDLGADELSGRERHCVADDRMARTALRAQAVPHDLHRVVYLCVCLVRNGR